MKDLGTTKKILSMEIIRENMLKNYTFSQKGYINRVLRPFNNAWS